MQDPESKSNPSQPGGAADTTATSCGRRPSEFVRFVVTDLAGRPHEVTPDGFRACPALRDDDARVALLRRFVENEIGQRDSAGEAPPHIAMMRRHELVDYCDASEKGHMKWYPKGVLIQRLLLDYAAGLARKWGAFEMKNPMLIRGDHNVVGELMGEFHERDYRVDGGRGVGYLRYASDPLAFPFLHEVRFSRKQTPLRVYEEASCFRNEQDGEVSGLKRVRNFLMTDMHAACASEDQARGEFDDLCQLFARLMDDIIAPRRWVLGWEGTVEFFEAHRAWLLGIGAALGLPAFFKLMPRMTHYYAMKNEFQAITADGSNVQVGTIQWDVKDGERFDIGFVDSDGAKRPCPVIIHASSFGSIERTLCALLETIAAEQARGVRPGFPFWLAPTQVRLAPVSDAHHGFALDLCHRLSLAGLRADVDDRDESVGRKIRSGEKEWAPYLLVVGEKEATSGMLQVRRRGERQPREMALDALIARALDEQGEMPRRPLPLPERLSQRPIFIG